jgi:hypothetical protein
MTTVRWFLDRFPRPLYFWVGMLAGAALAVAVQFLTTVVLIALWNGGAL